MRLKNIKLTEFKQHRKFEADLDAPVVGVTGINHSGKTSLLRAIRWLLTGRLDGKQEHHVYGYGQREPQTAIGALTFEKGGHAGTITRSCGASSKRELVWDGVKYTKAAEVDEKMGEIFGADINSVDRVMFIKQGELASALFGTPADRERLFVTILDVSYLAKSAEALDDKIKAFEEMSWSGGAELMESLRDSIVNLELELTNAVSRLRTVSGARESLVALRQLKYHIDLKDNAERSLRALHARAASLVEQMAVRGNPATYREKIAGLRAELLEVSKELDRHAQSEKLAKERETLKADISGLTAIRETLTAPIPNAESTRKEFVQLMDLATRLDTVGIEKCRQAIVEVEQSTASLAVLAVELSTLTSSAPVLHEKVETSKYTVSTLTSELSILNYALQFVRMKKEGECSCPMCGTKTTAYHDGDEDKAAAMVSSKQGQLAANRAALTINEENKNKNEALRSGLADRIDRLLSRQGLLRALLETVFQTTDPALCKTSLESYECAQAAYAALVKEEDTRDKQLQVILPALESRERSLASLQDVSSPASDIQTLRQTNDKLTTELTTATSDLESAEKLMAAALETRNTIDEAAASLGLINQALQTASADMDPDFVNKCVFNPDYLLKEMNTLEEDARHAGELEGAMAAYRKQLAEARTKFDDAGNKAREFEVRLEFVERLKRARDVFKKGALPTAYVERKFGELCEASKEFLGRTDASFEIERDPEQTVGFVFREMEEEDAVWQPQESLSGGQKVRLSIAFLIAVQQVLIPDLGLLILDEPSQHVDIAGVESFQELLSGIGQLLSDGGSQIIVCDHNENLAPAYDIHIPL
jgi:DNA repair exonuclease SbcCD ATPase subunit